MAKVKQFIFFDFEMLCANKGLTFEAMEAIRLGAVKYDLETEQITSFDQFIKPISTKPLSNFCKTLTGIKDEDLQDAASFKVVFKDFLTWVGGVKKSRFFSWSPSDLSRLKLDALKHEVSQSTINKIEKRYVDFQAIFTKRVSNSNVSVEGALKLYELDFIGEKHNPMYDAYNTLRIYLQFLDQPLASDLIMLKTFIFETEDFPIEQMNKQLQRKLMKEVSSLFGETDIFHIKEAKKRLKQTRNLVKKYHNILINRSGIFNKENQMLVEQLISFYHDFIVTYEEHKAYSSNILILSDYVITSVEQLTLKRG